MEIEKIYLEALAVDLSYTFKKFVQYFWAYVDPRPYIENFVHDCICDHLQHLGKDYHRLLLNTHRGCGKTTLVSVLYPAWLWLNRANLKILTASYRSTLSDQFSLKSRALLLSPQFRKVFPRLTLSEDKNTIEVYHNTLGGEKRAIATGGVAVGLRADALLVDDVHQANESELERQSIIDWYEKRIFPCVNTPDGFQALIMQRMGTNDLSAAILRNKDDDTVHCEIPLEWRGKRYVGAGFLDPRTTEGDVSVPEIFPAHVVKTFKKNMGLGAFHTQMNQDPSITDIDNLFKLNDVTYYKEADGCYFSEGKKTRIIDCERLCAVDLAISPKGDFTVMIVGDVAEDGRIFVRYMFRDRIPFTEIVRQLQRIDKEWSPSYFCIENRGFQQGVIDDAQAKGLCVVPYTDKARKKSDRKDESAKVVRSLHLQVKVQTHKFHLPEGAAFNDTLLAELLAFPNCDHDDVTDCCSIICNAARTLVAEDLEDDDTGTE